MDQATDLRLRGLANLVGNTPLLAVSCTFRGKPRTVYAKAENLNMTGSIKDRMALHILRCSRPEPGSSRPRAATPGSRSPPSAARSATR
jgi:hypothetical protein